jgi:TolB-like protein
VADTPTQLADALRARYEIQRELGRGGMATVYLARDRKHSRSVAVKVFQPELAATLGAERFLREIELAAGLTHPHIVPVYDSGDAGGRLYYVMPYVEGESLHERLARDRRLPVDEAVRLAREVADALDYAHRRGIIHRDIKPENILLEEGHAVVTDFGIARAVSTAGGERLTQTGSPIGTPMYMSPEQAAGELDIDGRADIYSLGCVLFEALTGVPPFSGPTAWAILVRRLTESPPLLRSVDPAIPAAVEAAVARALAQDPADRFATGAGFSAALGRGPPAEPGLGSGEGPFVSGVQPMTEASVAVLPFVNLSADRENEYFSDGITEEIINALAQVKGLRVVARTSCFAFKGKDVDAREIGERLNVRTLVEGSVRKAGDRIRIVAQLVNAADGYHLWSNTYERTLADVFAVQDELARSIATVLRRTVGRTESGPLVKPSTGNLDAYTFYMRGQYSRNKRSPEGFRAAIEDFERAIALDPDYPLPHSGIAWCYLILGFDEIGVMPPAEAMPKARAAAARALELDPALPDAHGARATIAFLYDWDWKLAESEFAQASSLGPDSSGSRSWQAMFLALMGRHEEAMQVISRAQGVDPVSLLNHLTVGRCHYLAGRFEQALAQLRSCLEVDPGFYLAYPAIARTYLVMQQPHKALQEVERGLGLLGRVPLFLVYAGWAHAALGERDKALGILGEFRELAASRYVPPAYAAQVLGALGELDEAFRMYQLAYEQRSGWLVFLRGEPLWDFLRPDPRFRELLRKMRLDF